MSLTMTKQADPVSGVQEFIAGDRAFMAHSGIAALKKWANEQRRPGQQDIKDIKGAYDTILGWFGF